MFIVDGWYVIAKDTQQTGNADYKMVTLEPSQLIELATHIRKRLKEFPDAGFFIHLTPKISIFTRSSKNIKGRNKNRKLKRSKAKRKTRTNSKV